MSTLSETDLCKIAQEVITIEAKALHNLANHIDTAFAQACNLFLACTGRIVVLGMGKSGHIAGKIAATLASTGSPALFVHPADASHGDLGMITSKDAVLAISNSGMTNEILVLIPLIKRLGLALVSMTGNPRSALAQASRVHLHVNIEQEACPLGLAPTASTTAALAMGDAIAVTLLKARGFTAEDFAFSHPGGALGRRLLLTVADLMRIGDAVPLVAQGTIVSEALMEISQKGLGITGILNASGVLIGVFTDGDLRRTLDKNIDIRSTCITDVMTPGGKTVTADILAYEVLQMMEQCRVTAILVIDDACKPIGVIGMHDLLQAGLI